MTRAEKEKQFNPQRWDLYCNGEFVDSFESHAAAKKAKYFKNKSASANYTDEHFEIRKRINHD